MLDWIKFFPFDGREHHNPKEICGPYLRKPQQNKWHMGDNLLLFSAPISNPIFGFSGQYSSTDKFTPGRADILKGDWQRVFIGSEAPKDDRDLYQFYSNTWYFVGPWFTGFQARLKAIGLLIKPKSTSPSAKENLLHPRAFESAIAYQLDVAYGYKRNGSKPRYRGPLNWQILKVSSCIHAVICDIHHIGNGSKDNPTLQRLVFIPVSTSSFIQITFDFGGTNIYHDPVRAEPLLHLCKSITDSFQFRIGERTQAEWNKVKSTCPDMSITENFGELPWPLEIEKSSKRSREIDITPSLNNPDLIATKSGSELEK